jgi:hypothetical protein
MGRRLPTSLAGKVLPAATLLLIALATPPAHAASSLASLNGYWSGGGKVTPLKGGAKTVSCRATYKVAGNTVSQNLRCSGQDYKFSTNFNFTEKGGRISGSWTESTYSAAGRMSGSASGSGIRAAISGDKFSGRMSIKISGSRQSIYIVELDKGSGRYVPVANLSLHK